MWWFFTRVVSYYTCLYFLLIEPSDSSHERNRKQAWIMVRPWMAKRRIERVEARPSKPKKQDASDTVRVINNIYLGLYIIFCWHIILLPNHFFADISKDYVIGIFATIDSTLTLYIILSLMLEAEALVVT